MEEYQEELRFFLYIKRKNSIGEPVWLSKICSGFSITQEEARKVLNLLEAANLIQKKKNFVLNNRYEKTYHLTKKGRLLIKQS